MPIVPIPYVGRRVTVTRQGSVQRPYRCAGCGYAAQVEIHAAASADAEGSIVLPAGQIETEARERAEARLADEMQDLFDLVPCPACGARSENAGLYRQNTVILVLGCLGLGAALGVYAYMSNGLRSPAGTGADSPLASLIYAMALGVALACACWYRRHERVQRVCRAVRFLPADEAPPPRAPRRSGA